MVKQVNEFINENILHSEAWDTAEDSKKKKAVNQSTRTLKRYFPNEYADSIPVEHLAEQSLWILRIDDFISRAELGVTNVSIDGMTVTVKAKDTSLCPFLLEYFNLPEGWNCKRRVVSYSTSLYDSNRKGWI